MKAPFTPGTLLAGRYRLLAQIGAGGFGTVYQARDQRKYGTLVAIKAISMARLSAQEKIEVTDSFNREIMVLSRLRHKHLPCILDQFTDPEHWYIVMEYIEGQTLEDLLARSPVGRLSVEQTARIGCALCDVLSYLHKQDPPIIFRDVKPGNIMLTPWDRLYLIDFGIARRYRPGQRHDTGALGSPGYAAPEQYGRGQTTALTDIYGLGATLQTLLTGKEPLEIRQHGLPPDVRLPTNLQALITRMLDPDPSRRPQSMAEVKRALRGSALSSWQSALSSWGWMAPALIAYSHIIIPSGFMQSPLLELYLLLVLVSIVSNCIAVLRRARQAAQARLSAKATTILLAKQCLPSLQIAWILLLFVSLPYTLRAWLFAWLPFSLTFYMILSILLVIMAALLALILSRRYGVQQPNRTQKASQIPPPQQQQQKHQT